MHPPIRVDRPAERHLRRLGHPVEDRLGPDLVEPGRDRVGRLEMAHDRLVAVAGQMGGLFRLESLGCSIACERYVRTRSDDPSLVMRSCRASALRRARTSSLPDARPLGEREAWRRYPRPEAPSFGRRVDRSRVRCARGRQPGWLWPRAAAPRPTANSTDARALPSVARLRRSCASSADQAPRRRLGGRAVTCRRGAASDGGRRGAGEAGGSEASAGANAAVARPPGDSTGSLLAAGRGHRTHVSARPSSISTALAADQHVVADVGPAA